MRQVLGQAAAIASALLVCSPVMAAEQELIKPSFPISMAAKVPAGAVRNGPLFKVVKSANGNFAQLLAAHVKLESPTLRLEMNGTAEVIPVLKSIALSCIGPFSIDEASTKDKARAWVQTSWVCRMGENEPVRAYANFSESPELDVQFDFQNGRISGVYLVPIATVPMLGLDTLLPMDAAETMGKAAQ